MQQIKPVILVIDADSASRNYIAVMLRKSGYLVLLAASGREGLVAAWRDLPNAIIVDPALPDIKGAELMARIRQDHRTEKVPCIALSSVDHPQEMAQLLSSGFNEGLVKSNRAFSEILEKLPRLLFKDSGTKEKGLLFVFLSAKGGVGTSSLCANIAMCVGKEEPHAQVAVIDLVLPIGSIADIVGYSDHMNIVSVAMQNPQQITPHYFLENLPKIPKWYFHLLAGSPDPESANKLIINRIESIIASIQESFDYVFIDLGRALSRISLPIIQNANVIPLILGTDLSTITLTQTVWKYLNVQGVEAQRIYPILNRAVGLEGITKSEAEEMLGLGIRMTMPYMGGNFTLANNHHEPLTTKYPNDSATFMLLQASKEIPEEGKNLRV